jgi:hypothetical protein
MAFLSANDEVHCNRTFAPTREDDLDPLDALFAAAPLHKLLDHAPQAARVLAG